MFREEIASRVAEGKPKQQVKVKSVAAMRSGSVKLDDGTVLELPPAVRSRLLNGQSVNLLTYPKGEPALIRLEPFVVGVQLDEDRLNEILASGLPGDEATAHNAAMALLAGNPALAAWGIVEGSEFSDTLVRYSPPKTVAPGVAPRLFVHDMAALLAQRRVRLDDGRYAVVELDAAAVKALRHGDHAEAKVGRQPVTLLPSSDGIASTSSAMRANTTTVPAPDKYDTGEAGTVVVKAPAGSSPMPPPGQAYGPAPRNPPTYLRKWSRPRGLPLAILLPWRQTWTLDGFTRGNLISSIALAPGEEVTLDVASWENRKKSLEQSTEMDLTQQVDFTSTTRDTEDCFKEVIKRNDFQWQLQAGVDACYTTGMATISAHADGAVNNADSLADTFRHSTQHLQETSIRAATTVRSRRVTRITETEERGSTEHVTRRIRNNNRSYAMTFDFHEVLAHYTVKTRFRSDRVRLVVLIPNPVEIQKFDSLVIRQHEGALRQALLDTALADGFDAERLLASYAFAKAELISQAATAAAAAALERKRKEDAIKADGTAAAAGRPDPLAAGPEREAVLAALKDVATSTRALMDTDITPALNAIAQTSGHTVDPGLVNAAQRWLYWSLLAQKMPPSLRNTLRTVALSTPLTIDIARQMASALPARECFPTLGTLDGLCDADKEAAGLFDAVCEQEHYLPGDWPCFWHPNCKDKGLYRADDAGLAAASEQLREAWLKYKSAVDQANALKMQGSAGDDAGEDMTAASFLDKLEMKYGLEVVAAAKERVEALEAHLMEHQEYYRYVIFQSLPPGSQIAKIMLAAPQLTVGTFEPHVVAMNGPDLAIPLTPLGETAVAKLVKDLQQVLHEAQAQTEEAEARMPADDVILPTPGVRIETRLARCGGAEPLLERLFLADVRKREAQADLIDLEVERRRKDLLPLPIYQKLGEENTEALTGSSAPSADDEARTR
jgi:hypothetical protein